MHNRGTLLHAIRFNLLRDVVRVRVSNKGVAIARY